MLFQSEHITAASGSVGGVTYSHNRAGMYRRARAVPVDPQTDNQTQVRSALTACVTAWVEDLTNAQRAAWDVYALNTPVVNALGASMTISGQNWFIACNTPRQQAASKLSLAGIPIIETAPTIFDRGTFTTPSVPTYDFTSGLSLAFTNADSWASAADAYMFIYQGRPRNASRNFFKGPYRLIASIAGDAVPPTSPFTLSAANVALFGYPLVIGQVIRTAVVVTRDDGRLSTRRELPDAVVVP